MISESELPAPNESEPFDINLGNSTTMHHAAEVEVLHGGSSKEGEGSATESDEGPKAPPPSSATAMIGNSLAPSQSSGGRDVLSY